MKNKANTNFKVATTIMPASPDGNSISVPNYTFSNQATTEILASNERVATPFDNSRLLYANAYQGTDGANNLVIKLGGDKVLSRIDVVLDTNDKKVSISHPGIVNESSWVVKNLDLFSAAYAKHSPEELPQWFNEMFIEVSERLIFDCETSISDFPEMLQQVYTLLMSKRVTLTGGNEND